MVFMDIRYLKIMMVRAGLSARSSMTSRNGTYTTDTAGNRVADREQYPALPAMWRDNRISEDVQYFYHHDAHGRLTDVRYAMAAATATIITTMSVALPLRATGRCTAGKSLPL
ncbi:hypothetical protein DKP19_25325 [Salmonella enterica subsp. salamae]|nr:hypothetical protein [Salmonella enterica subsp. salamae]